MCSQASWWTVVSAVLVLSYGQTHTQTDISYHNRLNRCGWTSYSGDSCLSSASVIIQVIFYSKWHLQKVAVCRSPFKPLTVTEGGVKLSQGDLSTVVPVPVARFMNAFVTFPKYVFFTKWCKNNDIILNRKWRILQGIREVRLISGVKIR